MTDIKKQRVLIVDDEQRFADLIAKELNRLSFSVDVSYDASSALIKFEEAEYDVVLLDLKLPDRSGLEVLKDFKNRDSLIEVIMLTGHGSLDSAIEAMKSGAYDYLTKPCKFEELSLLITRAGEKRAAHRENVALRQLLGHQATTTGLLVESDQMKRVLEQASKIAQAVDVPVLITGDSGTGKELIAREVHQRSSLSKAPFVALNCAALQSNLLESEIFGHEKGAFTGAVKRHDGIVEVARGGTLFLDEIGEVDESVQAKLLRFIQFGEYRRVGGTENRSVKLRIIAATNRDLLEEIKEGRFREDLYYRLNVAQLQLPALRDRLDDLEPLTNNFLARYRRSDSPTIIDSEGMELLKHHSWPGNVRELENFVRRLLIFHDGESIGSREIVDSFNGAGISLPDTPISLQLSDVTRGHILKVLQLCDGNKTRTAKTLGIALKTLYNKLNEYRDGSDTTDS